jgi:beta-carotene hydroxylase
MNTDAMDTDTMNTDKTTAPTAGSDREAARVAASLSGQVAWPTVLFALAVFAAYGLNFAAAASGALGLLPATCIAGLLVYATYTVFHEATHSNISGGGPRLQWLNELLGYTAALVMAIPFRIHRAEHFAHHGSTNNPGQDPDVIFSPGARINALSLFTGSLRAIPLQYSFYRRRVWPEANAAEKRTVAAETVAIVGSRVALALAGYPAEVLMVTVLANLLGNLIVTTFFAVAVHHPYSEQGRYLDTSTFIVEGPLNTPMTLLWLWQNYHSIHHLFPRVPFYRYGRVFDRIRGTMEERGAPIIVLGRPRAAG